MFPFGMVELGVEALAAFLAFGKVLHQQARCTHLLAIRTHCRPDQRGHLLGLVEIALARLGQAVTLERNDALVATLAACKVEGDRKVALAEQREERGICTKLCQQRVVVLHVAAQFPALVVAHEQAHRAGFGLRLHGHLRAVVLDEAAHQHGEHQRFGQQMLDRRRVIMRSEDFLERRIETHEPAAGMLGGDGEGEQATGIGLLRCVSIGSHGRHMGRLSPNC